MSNNEVSGAARAQVSTGFRERMRTVVKILAGMGFLQPVATLLREALRAELMLRIEHAGIVYVLYFSKPKASLSPKGNSRE